MNTGKEPFTHAQSDDHGSQRESSLKKVIKLLPARSKDNFLLLFLLILGVFGFAYIFTVPFGQKTNKQSLYDKIFNPTKEKSLTSDSLKSNLLKIGGELKVNEPMAFSFNMVSSDQDYKINFGDKQSAAISTNQFSHTYTESGTYRVRLIKTENGKEIVVHCEFLVIN